MFETINNIFNMPTVKLPQSFSRFGREATQVGDKGYAVPGNYYLGGNTAFSGGKTNFYPRSNLTTLSFQPLSNLNAPPRDYDQHHETGGPHGWIVRAMEAQEQQQQQQSQTSQNSTGNGPGTTISPSIVRQTNRPPIQLTRGRQGIRLRGVKPALIPVPLDVTPASSSSTTSSSSSQQQQQDNDQTQYSFDQNGKCLMQSKDTNHYIVVDQNGKQILINVPASEKIYVGGDGKIGSYAQLVTTKGPVINALGRYA